MKTIKDIQTKIDRRKKAKYIEYLSILILLVSISLKYFFYIQSTFILYLISLSISLFTIMIIFRDILELSAYERIRFSAYHLNDSLNKKETEKAVFYLNGLAENIVLFNNEMEEFPLQKHIIDVLEKILMLLKNKVYPDLLKENTDDCIGIVKNIQQAIEKEDINKLSNLVQNYSFENEKNILLPYERPSTLKKSFTIFLDTTIKTFYGYFIFRLIALMMTLSIIGYLISEAIPSIRFDSTLFGSIIVLALALAKEYGT